MPKKLFYILTVQFEKRDKGEPCMHFINGVLTQEKTLGRNGSTRTGVK